MSAPCRTPDISTKLKLEFRDKKAVLYDAVTSQFVSVKILIQLRVELPLTEAS